jgi:uncharacterized membrane protein YgaE (UPF0421/DUF939 family)
MKNIMSLLLFCSCMVSTSSHRIMDDDKYAHQYNKKITTYNKELNLYCKSHHRWEKVKMVNTRHGVRFTVK